MLPERVNPKSPLPTLAFVFDFLSQDHRENFIYPQYQQYQEKYPSRIDALADYYYADIELWQSQNCEVISEHLETLNMLVSCVNSWYATHYRFFLGMIPWELVKERMESWDKSDSQGLEEFNKAALWWHEQGNYEKFLIDVQDCAEDFLGEEAYLVRKFIENSHDDSLDVCFTLFYGPAPYDLESLGFVDSEGECDIPKEELEATESFLRSNRILIPLKNASDRFAKKSNFNV